MDPLPPDLDLHRFFHQTDARNWHQVERFFKFRDIEKSSREHYSIYHSNLRTVASNPDVDERLRKRAKNVMDVLFYDDFIQVFDSLSEKRDNAEAVTAAHQVFVRGVLRSQRGQGSSGSPLPSMHASSIRQKRLRQNIEHPTREEPAKHPPASSSEPTHMPKRSEEYRKVMKALSGTPLMPYYQYRYNKTNGVIDNPLPSMPSSDATEGWCALVEYAQQVLKTSEAHDEEAYLALSSIISANISSARSFFGPRLLNRVEDSITLSSFCSPVIFNVLDSLLSGFKTSDLDMVFFSQEIELRLKDIVHRERGNDTSNDNIRMELDISRKIYRVLNYFCTLILSGHFSETMTEATCIPIWSFVWTVLFASTNLSFITKELALKSTKADIDANERLFENMTQSGEKKTVTLMRIKQTVANNTLYFECAANEYKPPHTGKNAPIHQPSKLLRINKNLLVRTCSPDSIVFMDAHGLFGRIYGMKAISDFYGASKVLGTVCLPTTASEMKEFLSGPSIPILFRFREHWVRFASRFLDTTDPNRITIPSNPSISST